MHRFAVPVVGAPTDECELTGDIAHQIGRVLRLGAGSRIVLFDGRGSESEAVLMRVEPRRVRVQIGAASTPGTELPGEVRLCMALIQHSRFELVVQKATELGVTAIQPVCCSYSRSSGADHVPSQRLDRWASVIREAAEQSGRLRFPELHAPRPFLDVLAQRTARGAVGVLVDNRATPTPVAMLPLPMPVWLFVGPEGGFSDGERQAAAESGLRLVRLGCRIMRAETAAIASLAVIVAQEEGWGRAGDA